MHSATDAWQDRGEGLTVGDAKGPPIENVVVDKLVDGVDVFA